MPDRSLRTRPRLKQQDQRLVAQRARRVKTNHLSKKYFSQPAVSALTLGPALCKVTKMHRNVGRLGLCSEVAMATKCKPLRTNFHCQLPFKRPILEFTNTPGRFFSMMYHCLAGEIQVNTSDFSVRTGNTLGEAQAKYNIFGGVTSVTMHPDRLAFDFPNLIPNDFPLVRQIIEAAHDAFPKEFAELDYERAEMQTHEHLDVMHETKVQELLAPYEIKSVSAVFGKGRVVQLPAAKSELISEDQRWQCTCTIERSLLKPTAVFVALMTSLRKLTPQGPFIEKAELARQVSRSCLAVFGLEVDDAAT